MTRIVVIDDDAAMRTLLSKMLSKEGYDVVTASDGTIGERLVAEADTDLVVTDIIMPNREGLETILSLKRAQPGLPVIAISGGGRFGNLDVLKSAHKLGADRILEKPLDRKALLGAVSELLS